MANFKDVKVGDTIIVSNGMRDEIHKVVRVTKTLFATDSVRFRKSTGIEVGDYAYHYLFAKKATPEIIKRLETKE